MNFENSSIHYDICSMVILKMELNFKLNIFIMYQRKYKNRYMMKKSIIPWELKLLLFQFIINV